MTAPIKLPVTACQPCANDTVFATAVYDANVRTVCHVVGRTREECTAKAQQIATAINQQPLLEEMAALLKKCDYLPTIAVELERANIEAREKPATSPTRSECFWHNKLLTLRGKIADMLTRYRQTKASDGESEA